MINLDNFMNKYMSSFRQENVYIQPKYLFKEKGADDNPWIVCNNETKPCYGNGAYDFEAMVMNVNNQAGSVSWAN